MPRTRYRSPAVAVVGGIAAALLSLSCASASSGSRPGADPALRASRELSRDEQVRHVLSRLTFGARPADAERVNAVGVDAWIEAQLAPQGIADTLAERVLATMETQRKQAFELTADHPDPQEVQNYFNARAKNAGLKTVEISAEDSTVLRASQQKANQLTAEIPAARLLRAVTSERQLQEVMTDFWENHFSVFLGKSPNRYSMVEYDRDVVRPRALGKFRALLGAVARSPEMLFYLDNVQSGVDSLHPNVMEERIEARRADRNADSPARLLAHLPRRRPRGLNENYARELLELHTLGVDGGYTQHDVEEVARALSGWTIEAPQMGGGFVFHPELHDAGEKTVLGHVLPAGRGIEDGEEVLDIVARAPGTARFITTKLARHFVSDDPPRALIDRCAKAFSASDGDIRVTMRCIIRSPEFFSRSAYRAKVKTPFELVASTMRALAVLPDTTPRSAQLVAQLGQPIYGRLTPDGWPDTADAWMNSGAILNRINFGLRVAAGQVPSIRIGAWPGVARLSRLPVAEQVEGVIVELLGGRVAQSTRDGLMASGGLRPQVTGLTSIVGLALGSPEFQRR
jgi:uncharacterized protein (DUF1800 family)